MAKNNNLTDFLTGLADKLRSRLGTAGLIDPQTFEAGIDAVYTAGVKLVAAYGDGNITIPEGVTSIREYAFYYYDASDQPLNIVLPDTLNEIGQSAFESAYIGSIDFGSGLTAISNSCFKSVYFADGAVLDLPANIQTVEYEAFYGCEDLTDISWSEGLTIIGDRAFNGCTGLTGTLTLPDSVSRIGASAFRNCTGLSKLFLGSGITHIADYAFGYCKNITEIHIAAAVPPVLGSARVFSPNGANGRLPTDCVVYVPAGSLEAYQAATNWSSFASQIEEEAANND